jgi:serine/threonine protein phosphatase PrpC
VKVDSHISRSKAKVGRGALHRHEAGRYENGLGLPRTWRLTHQAVLEGFGEGLTQSNHRGGDRLQDAYAYAREVLARRVNALIERSIPDTTFAGVLIDQGTLHVMSTGPARVYLHRRGRAQRLTQRDEELAGVLEGTATRTSVELEPEDVVLLGTGSAFSSKAVTKLASVLEADGRTPVAVLASLLTEPAGVAGAGAAAIVLRVR